MKSKWCFLMKSWLFRSLVVSSLIVTDYPTVDKAVYQDEAERMVEKLKMELEKLRRDLEEKDLVLGEKDKVMNAKDVELNEARKQLKLIPV